MIVAISFTSESSDRYLSLFKDVESVEELAEWVKDEYLEMFPYLHIDQVVVDDKHMNPYKTIIPEIQSAIYRSRAEC